TGLPGDTIDAQMQAARDLLLANGISEQRVAVVDHLTQDGNIIIQTPEDTPEETVLLEVQNLPGFVSVQPFVDGEEEEGGGEPDPDFGEIVLPQEVGPGTNLAVGLSATNRPSPSTRSTPTTSSSHSSTTARRR